MLVTVIEDYRLRTDQYPLPGDRCTLRDGSPGIITALTKVAGKWYYFTAPEWLVDRSSYLGEYREEGKIYPKWIN